MANQETTTRELVLRAMAATEIAESATDATLRAAFFSLAAFWLEEAERLCEARAAERPAPRQRRSHRGHAAGTRRGLIM